MTTERLRRALLRWDRLLPLAAILLPLLILSTLGFLWLGERGLLAPVLGGFIGFGALVWAIRAVARFHARRRRATEESEAPQPDPPTSVAPDPDWGEAETAAFRRAQARIRAATREPLDWKALPEQAREVIDGVARDLRGESATLLDFTAPEALLLVARVAERYRELLRRRVPFSDRVRLKTLRFLYENRARGRLAWSVAQTGYRLGRFALNPSTAVLREIQDLVAGGHRDYLTAQMAAEAQAMLLEEAAHAAVELYSGRLRFSDAELLEMELAATAADRARLAQPPEPLRAVVVGQVSAGKSTLIDALRGETAVETDMAPATDRLTTYEHEIDGLPCHLVDTPGLDGSAAREAALLGEMAAGDLVLWTVRANRPARAPDQSLMRRFAAAFAERPERRRPPVILLATAIDRLAPDDAWPYPEHRLPEPVLDRFGEAVDAIARDLGGPTPEPAPRPIPISAAPPEWNLDALRAALEGALGEALMVQRNRRRLETARRESGPVAELLRGGRGALHGARGFGGRLARRTLTGEEAE